MEAETLIASGTDILEHTWPCWHRIFAKCAFLWTPWLWHGCWKCPVPATPCVPALLRQSRSCHLYMHLLGSTAPILLFAAITEHVGAEGTATRRPLQR